MNIFSNLGNSRISTRFCSPLIFFSAQLAPGLRPNTCIEKPPCHALVSPARSEVLSGQYKQFKQMKKRAGSTLIVLD